MYAAWRLSVRGDWQLLRGNSGMLSPATGAVFGYTIPNGLMRNLDWRSNPNATTDDYYQFELCSWCHPCQRSRERHNLAHRSATSSSTVDDYDMVNSPALPNWHPPLRLTSAVSGTTGPHSPSSIILWENKSSGTVLPFAPSQ